MALAIGGLLACSIGAAERTGDLKKLQGVWTVTDMKCIGLDDSKVTGQAIFVIEGDTLSIKSGEGIVSQKSKVKLDPTAKIKTMDWTILQTTYGQITSETNPPCLSIYELDGDDLKVCWPNVSGKRPVSFELKQELEVMVITLKRQQPAVEEVNLLVNGSFEEGPEVQGFVALDPDSESIKGWTVTRGQIDYIGTHWISGDGKHSLDLHGSPGFGGVKQSFKTEKGQRYRVSFLMAGSSGLKPSVNTLCVRAADKKQVFSFQTDGKTLQDMGWERKSWEFTAVDDETVLEIHTLDDEHGMAGPALDDVKVVTVPAKK